jgi:mRNA interferase RelE/StbE
MRHEVLFDDEAIGDLRSQRAFDRARILDAVEVHLRHEPTKESKSRIKRLRGTDHPQYRLRVDEFRVFYDVAEGVVQVIAVVPKSEAAEWLARRGGSS